MERTPAAHPGRAEQGDVGVEDGVDADLDAGLDHRAGRLQHRHPGPCEDQQAAVEQAAVDRGQLGAVVDSLRLRRVGEGQQLDALAAHRRGGGGVGQVELALRVVRGQGREVGEDLRGRQGVESGVDQTHRQLFGGGVAGLDDAAEAAVGPRDHPPQHPGSASSVTAMAPQGAF